MGLFQPAPGRRFAYDADGTYVSFYNLSSGDATSITDAGLASLNQETYRNVAEADANVTASNGRYYSFLFPQDREIDGVFVSYGTGDFQGTPLSLEYSTDTTNGHDGTWSDDIVDIPNAAYPESTYAFYRDEITASSLGTTTVKAVRIEWSTIAGGSYVMSGQQHIYGYIPLSESPNRIIFLDTNNSDQEFTRVLDYEERERGTTNNRTIKIKNNSASLTANTVQLTAEDLYLNAGGWYTFSEDDVTYQGTLTITSVAADTEDLVYVRQTIPTTEFTGPQTARIRVNVTSFS